MSRCGRGPCSGRLGVPWILVATPPPPPSRLHTQGRARQLHMAINLPQLWRRSELHRYRWSITGSWFLPTVVVLHCAVLAGLRGSDVTMAADANRNKRALEHGP